jgi:hypothetical protein
MLLGRNWIEQESKFPSLSQVPFADSLDVRAAFSRQQTKEGRLIPRLRGRWMPNCRSRSPWIRLLSAKNKRGRNAGIEARGDRR